MDLVSIIRKDIWHWLLIALAGLVLFFIALWGWYDTQAEYGIHYSPAQLAKNALGTTISDGDLIVAQPPEKVDYRVGLAQVGVKVLLAVAALKGLYMLLDQQVKVWRFRQTTGHTVICGAGARGRNLALQLMHQNKTVALIEINKDADNVAELVLRGALLLEGNALSRDLLIQARAVQAAEVVSVTPSDETNIAIIREVGNLAHQMDEPAPRFFAGVESAELRSFFRDRLPGTFGQTRSIPRLIGFQTRGARTLLANLAMMLASRPEIRQQGARVFILASPGFRDDLIRSAVTMLQISGVVKPALTLISVDEADRRLFQARYPAAPLAVDLRWYSGSMEELLAAEPEGRPGLIICALEEDAETLEAADLALRRSGLPHKNVVACLWKSGELTKLAMACARNEKIPTPAVESIFGLALNQENEPEDADPLDQKIDEEARLLHEDYQKSQAATAGNNTSVVPWEELPEHLRESNRLAALHNKIKRVIWETRAPMADEETHAFLAATEHMRWMAEKVMDGWQPGPRDNFALRHPDLRLFSELAPESQQKDLNLAKLGLEFSNPSR